ncbi:MAG TPA: hypothetical protein PLB91_13785 [Spirochaetales bacterium]|nr:hypothetical protein [Spirochaetales bacterium]HRY56314.1 hypothetical protein [Spirochaetia bacterium]HRZ64315.1 hypothetical protein [Spirochaetia bacterium]
MIITLYKTGAGGKTLYYTIHDRQQLLDAPFALSAAFRVGLGRERERLHRFEKLADRDRMIRSLVARRLKDGYRLLYTFSRSGFSASEGLAEALGETRVTAIG